LHSSQHDLTGFSAIAAAAVDTKPVDMRITESNRANVKTLDAAKPIKNYTLSNKEHVK
jgi:hypothetical protein